MPRSRHRSAGRGARDATADAGPAGSAFWPACAALYVVAAWLLWPTLGAALSPLDDLSALQHAASESLSQIWQRDHFGHYRPAKKLLFWSMAHAGVGLSAVRVAILIAYLCTGALVQRLATLASGERWVGLAAAMLFLLNPTALGVASWLSASHLVLCLLFVLGYVLLAERACAAPDSAPRRAAAALALCALAGALLSDPLALLAPLLLLALGRGGASKRVVWLHVGSAALIAAYLVLQLGLDRAPPPYRSADTPRWLLSFSAARYMIGNALIWLWPRDRYGVLLVDDPGEHLLASGACWAALAAGFALAWRCRLRAADAVFGLIWLALLLAAVSNVVPLGNTPLAAHYMYMPSAGAALALAAATRHGLARLAAPRTRAVLALALAAAVQVAWLPDARRIVAAWSRSEQIFVLSRRNHPDNVELLVNLAALELQEGDHAAAARWLERAARLAPDDLNVVRNQYALLWQTERFAQALQLLDAHPELAGEAEFAMRRGEVLEELARWQEAARAFERTFGLASAAHDRELRYAAGVRLVTAWVRIEQFGRAEQLTARLLAEYPGRPEITAIAELLARARGARP